MFDLWLNITIRAKIIENITNDILLPGTIKFQGMNRHSTGNNIAAIIDPIDTILNTIMIINANTRQINPILQLIIINTPNDVATPFPPLKLKKHGNVCPNTTANPAISTKSPFALLSACIIFPIIMAINIAITPFNMSHINVKAAACFPATLNTFVEPAFLLPFSLTSTPANFFEKI